MANANRTIGSFFISVGLASKQAPRIQEPVNPSSEYCGSCRKAVSRYHDDFLWSGSYCTYASLAELHDSMPKRMWCGNHHKKLDKEFDYGCSASLARRNDRFGIGPLRCPNARMPATTHCFWFCDRCRTWLLPISQYAPLFGCGSFHTPRPRCA